MAASNALCAPIYDHHARAEQEQAFWLQCSPKNSVTSALLAGPLHTTDGDGIWVVFLIGFERETVDQLGARRALAKYGEAAAKSVAAMREERYERLSPDWSGARPAAGRG